MPFSTSLTRAASLLTLAVLLAAGAPAMAGSPGARGPGDALVYADPFGNLVIHSHAGYKRIVVGKGHLADELGAGDTHKPTIVYGRPKTAYLEKRADGHLYLRKDDDCRYGARLHGRSHMYGLPRNVVPVPVVTCRGANR